MTLVACTGVLVLNSNNNHQENNNKNNIQHLLSAESMPGKVLSDLLIQFLIPQIMMHYLKLSKDSDCSLAMARGPAFVVDESVPSGYLRALSWYYCPHG